MFDGIVERSVRYFSLAILSFNIEHLVAWFTCDQAQECFNYNIYGTIYRAYKHFTIVLSIIS